MAFKTLDLPGIYNAADQAQAAQSASITDRLQRQYLGQRIEAGGQELAANAANQQMKVESVKAQQGYLKLAYAERSGNPRAALLSDPEFVKNWESQGVPVKSMDDQQFSQFFTALKGHLGAAAGISPPVQVQTIGDVSKPAEGVYQKNPETGEIKQITAPQKPDYGGARLSEQSRHNRAMETKGNLPASADNVDAAANAISNYQQAPLGAFAMRSPYGQAVMAKVMELNPDYQANEFGSRSKAYKDFASGKNGNQVRSFNVAISHLDSLQKIADTMDNGDLPLLNKMRNEFARQTGKAAPNTFDGMKKIVTDEIVKSIVGAGGGVADREEASKTIAAANSPAQLAGIMNGYKELMAGQLGGLKQQYEQTTGRKDFPRFLTPEAKSYLDTHELSAAPQQLQGGGNHPPAIQSLLDKYK